MSAADIQAITVHHNRVRADVGVAPLRWSPALANYGQRWAEHLAATSCGLQHRTKGDYGENLFQGTLGFYHAADAALAWEGEKKDYRGGAVTAANAHAVGHYTQMVWRDTTSFGCGLAVCRDTLIVACNYDPPGNYIGKAPY